MKKLKVLFVAIFALVLVVTPCVNAATAEDIVSFAKQEHVIAGQSVTLSSADVQKIEDFFKENEINAEQGEFILSKVKEAIDVTNKTSSTGLEAMPATAKQEVIALLNEAGSVVGVTVSYNSADKTMDIFQNGVKIDAVDLSGKLPFTGSNTIVYIAVAIIAVAAIAVFAVAKKGKLVNAK